MRIRKTRNWMIYMMAGTRNDTQYQQTLRYYRRECRRNGFRGNGLSPSITPEFARLNERINWRDSNKINRSTWFQLYCMYRDRNYLRYSLGY